MLTLSKKSARSLARRAPADIAAAINSVVGKEHKYHAETDRRVLEMNGVKFDSLAELSRYAELKMLMQAGKIQLMIVHPRYPIKIGGCHICDVVLDFEYVNDNDEIIYVDVKGHDNALSRLKRKLVEAMYGIKVTVIRC